MRSWRGEWRGAAAALACVLCAGPARSDDEAPRDISEVDLSGLLDLSLASASLREEHASEAAATVFVLDGEDLRRQGFQTLEEALRSVPGLFGYRDGLYGFIGVRGVGLLSDYTTRLLVLVDGHPVNDAVGIGASYVGRDVPVVLDAVRRLEVIKGPVGSVYGPTAFLGVVNVVTLAPATPGGEVRVGLEQRQGRLSGAEMSTVVNGARGDVEWVAALDGVASNGQTWKFPELARDAARASPPGGSVAGVDGASSLTGTLRVSWAGLQAAGACNRDEAQLPSAPYGSLVGDERNRRRNQRCYADGVYVRALAPGLTLRTRAAFDWFDFRDGYAYAPPREAAELLHDLGNDKWWTGELRLEWEPDSATRGMAGVTAQVHDAVQRSWSSEVPTLTEDPAHGVGVGDIRTRWTSANLYALVERQLLPSLRVHAGATFFAHSLYGTRLTPKMAAVWTPRPDRTVKLVYSEGFRPPVASEAFFEDGTSYLANARLRPETVRSLELSSEARVGNILTLSGSLFASRYGNLIRIETVPAPGDPGALRQQSQNQGSTDVQGAELALNLRWREWIWAYGGVNAQRTGRAERVNFPDVTANLALSTRPVPPLTLAVNGTFAARRSKDVDRPAGARPSVPPAVQLNAHARLELFSAPGLTLELGVENLLDAGAPSPVAADFYPVSEHPEPARTFRAALRWSTR
jgi:iron complex outermembrane receptor protein